MNVMVTAAGYEMVAQALGNFSPADATTYYFGNATLNPTSAAADLFQLPIFRTGVITDAYIYALVVGTLGSGESSTFAFRLNNTSDSTLSSTFVHSSVVNVQRVTGLSIPVTAGDDYEIKWTTPTWATNPTAIYLEVRLFVRVP
jgi:hypothetical protein